MIRIRNFSSLIWNKKIKLPFALLLCAVVVFYTYAFRRITPHENQNTIIKNDNDCVPSPVIRYRLNDFKYTHPLLLSDRLNESKELFELKNSIAHLIENQKASGVITSATVYIRTLSDNKWISVNNETSYSPGSLIKVPVMLAYLKEAEKNPEILNKLLSLEGSSKVPSQTFKDDRIIPGKSYSIKKLIYFMIVKSDNYATLLLNNYLNFQILKKLFTDLGLPEPDLHDPTFQISASNYSKFFRILYNSSYLTPELSDYALSLLVESNFKNGIVKAIPNDIKVAHKFGENYSAESGGIHQLHETGIIFKDGNPILITIMTKGKKVELLPEVLSQITRMVIQNISHS